MTTLIDINNYHDFAIKACNVQLGLAMDGINLVAIKFMTSVHGLWF